MDFVNPQYNYNESLFVPNTTENTLLALRCCRNVHTTELYCLWPSRLNYDDIKNLKYNYTYNFFRIQSRTLPWHFCLLFVCVQLLPNGMTTEVWQKWKYVQATFAHATTDISTQLLFGNLSHYTLHMQYHICCICKNMAAVVLSWRHGSRVAHQWRYRPYRQLWIGNLRSKCHTAEAATHPNLSVTVTTATTTLICVQYLSMFEMFEMFEIDRDVVMATLLVVRRLSTSFHPDRISWRSRINSKLVIQYDLQSRRNFSLKLLNMLSKGIKKQLDNVKIFAGLRVSNEER